MFMDYAAYQVGRKGSLPPSIKVLHDLLQLNLLVLGRLVHTQLIPT